jgi:hypothetical protein
MRPFARSSRSLRYSATAAHCSRTGDERSGSHDRGQLLEVHDERAHLVILLLEQVIGAAHEGAADVPNAKLLPDSHGLEDVHIRADLAIELRADRAVMWVRATIAAGEWITATGDDRNNGQQFKARFLRTSAPTPTEGAERYLSSWNDPGIGPVYARKLVRAFVDTAFDIEAVARRLWEVDGVGPVSAQRTVAAWAEQKVVREIMVCGPNLQDPKAATPCRSCRKSAGAGHPWCRLQDRLISKVEQPNARSSLVPGNSVGRLSVVEWNRPRR